MYIRCMVPEDGHYRQEVPLYMNHSIHYHSKLFQFMLLSEHSTCTHSQYVVTDFQYSTQDHINNTLVSQYWSFSQGEYLSVQDGSDQASVHVIQKVSGDNDKCQLQLVLLQVLVGCTAGICKADSSKFRVQGHAPIYLWTFPTNNRF